MELTSATGPQTISDCRWSRPGYLPHGIVEPDYPEGLWVCVRPTRTTVRRPVTAEECAQCPHWRAAFPDEH
jgi:hypothetical protein